MRDAKGEVIQTLLEASSLLQPVHGAEGEQKGAGGIVSQFPTPRAPDLAGEKGLQLLELLRAGARESRLP